MPYGGTTYKTGDIVVGWNIIFQFFEYGNFEDEHEPDECECVKKSKIHKVVGRPEIIPYYDLVCWLISHDDISNWTIVNSSHMVVGSFIP